MASGSRPVRVLCLHGTCSSGAILKKQLSRMQPLLKGAAELVFVDGPLKAEEDNPMRAAQEKFFKGMDFFDFARWVKDEQADGDSAKFWEDLAAKHPDPEDMVKWVERHRSLHFKHSVERQYEELDEALEYLQEQLHKHKPIDGVLGFSQGANLASLLAAQAEAGHGADFSFVIHVCPARPGWVQQRPRLFRKPIPMRSFHISGRKDRNPPFPLRHLYENPLCFMHEDGHRPVPGTTVQAANQVVRFMLDFILGKPLELPPEPDVRQEAEAAGEAAPPKAAEAPAPPKAEAKAQGGPLELPVVVNVNKDLGVVFEFTVQKGTTVFGLKEMIAWQDPTDSLSAEGLALKLPDAQDALVDTLVITEALTTLDLCEL